MYQIDTVLDVGANSGQYGSELRKIGYKNRIISFEPLQQAFADLKRRSSGDSKWTCHNMGLGNSDTSLEIHVANNSFSSSFLDMQKSHLEAAPQAQYVKTEKISVRKLDSVMPELGIAAGEKIVLKMDVQGFEMRVLEGAAGVLDRVSGVDLEISFVELYAGETTYKDMINYLEGKGFTLCAFEQGLYNKATGELLQGDAIFFRIPRK